MKASMQLLALRLKGTMFCKTCRDSLRTYRITATSGDRDELLEIFSQHMASSQRSP